MKLKFIGIIILMTSCKIKELEKADYPITDKAYGISIGRDHGAKKVKKFHMNSVAFINARKANYIPISIGYDYKNRIEDIEIRDFDTNSFFNKKINPSDTLNKSTDTLSDSYYKMYFYKGRVEYIAKYAQRGAKCVRNGYMYQFNKNYILKGIYYFENDTLKQVIMTSPKFQKRMKNKFPMTW